MLANVERIVDIPPGGMDVPLIHDAVTGKRKGLRVLWVDHLRWALELQDRPDLADPGVVGPLARRLTLEGSTRPAVPCEHTAWWGSTRGERAGRSPAARTPAVDFIRDLSERDSEFDGDLADGEPGGVCLCALDPSEGGDGNAGVVRDRLLRACLVHVHFIDGTVRTVDTNLYASGFKASLPFPDRRCSRRLTVCRCAWPA